MSRACRLPPRRTLDTSTLAGAIKARCWDLDIRLHQLAPLCGWKPGTIRARLSKCRGKRAMQPWQVSAIAKFLGMDEAELHRLGARHEGWKV